MNKLNPKKMAKLKAHYESHIQAMIVSDFSKEKAAQLLGITSRTLYNRFKKFKEVGLHKTNTT